jgi:hypothetical protein
MTLLRCPRCAFSFLPRIEFLALDFCPRCLAESGVAVSLTAAAEPIGADAQGPREPSRRADSNR